MPRRPASKEAAKLSPGTTVESVVLKFQEGTHVRLRGRSLAALARDARESAKLDTLHLTPAQVENDLRAVQALLASSQQVRGLDRLFTIPEDDLAAWRASGEERSGQELADLDLYYQVQVSPGTTQAQIDLLLDTLNAIPSVEIAYAQAPPAVAEPGQRSSTSSMPGKLRTRTSSRCFIPAVRVRDRAITAPRSWA